MHKNNYVFTVANPEPTNLRIISGFHSVSRKKSPYSRRNSRLPLFWGNMRIARKLNSSQGIEVVRNLSVPVRRTRKRPQTCQRENKPNVMARIRSKLVSKYHSSSTNENSAQNSQFDINHFKRNLKKLQNNSIN